MPTLPFAPLTLSGITARVDELAAECATTLAMSVDTDNGPDLMRSAHQTAVKAARLRKSLLAAGRIRLHH